MNEEDEMFGDADHTTQEGTDDDEDEFSGITLSEVIAKYAKQASMLIITCVTIVVMIYIMVVVYNTLGTPDKSQQTGIGVLEWRE